MFGVGKQGGAGITLSVAQKSSPGFWTSDLWVSGANCGSCGNAFFLSIRRRRSKLPHGVLSAFGTCSVGIADSWELSVVRCWARLSAVCDQLSAKRKTIIHHRASVVGSVAHGADAQLVFGARKQGVWGPVAHLRKKSPLGIAQLIGIGATAHFFRAYSYFIGAQNSPTYF